MFCFPTFVIKNCKTPCTMNSAGCFITTHLKTVCTTEKALRKSWTKIGQMTPSKQNTLRAVKKSFYHCNFPSLTLVLFLQ